MSSFPPLNDDRHPGDSAVRGIVDHTTILSAFGLALNPKVESATNQYGTDERRRM